MKISQQYPEFGCSDKHQLESAETNTAFTQLTEAGVELKRNRPGLLFSSTSWTPDEDFSILMDALQGTNNQLKILLSI